ncbi:DUF416 family protein [Prevotella aurantiaca]|jgi:hypothetical protein|uniref:DUF416 family protein n=1 Tax=Prevotella aurantiaca TaxID=596085 RepID=UPI001CB02861|nr:DUF416 family protein [Prevotella aurantiaca]MBF1385910.1 hypothetical protein [Prevotella aurantiaca]
MNDDIKDLIATLPPHKQLLFGVCCVKRIENNLYKFLESRDEEPAFIAAGAITDELFRGCIIDNFPYFGMRFSKEEEAFIESLIPDTDEDGSKEVVFAQNAAIALAYCLRFTKEQNSDFMNYCGLKILETVDVMAFDSKGNESSDLRILHEIATQKKIIKLIDAMENNFDETDVVALKETIMQYAVG